MAFFKFTLFLALATLCSALKSPCPEIFNAETVKKSAGKWEGVLNLESEFDLSGMWVRVFFDKKAEKVGHESAEVVTDDHQSWLFRMPKTPLAAGKKVQVPFYVQYDEKAGEPSVVSIRLNARDVCPKKEDLVNISPCPAVFKYVHSDKKEAGKWHGELHLDSEFTLTGTWIRVHLDSPGKVVADGFGTVEPREHNSYLIKDKLQVVKPGQTLKVPFIVTFDDAKHVPNVDKVRLNGRTVCENKLVTKVKVAEEHVEKKEEKKVEKPEEKKEEKKEEKLPEKKEEKREDKVDAPRVHLDNAHHHPHH